MTYLRSLRLKNFRLHSDTFFQPSPNVNLLLGFEGQGKTSIGAALEIAINGRCEWQDGGQGLDTFITAEANQCVLATDMVNNAGQPVQWARHIPAQEGVNDLQKNVLAALGVSAAEVAACLRPGNFFAQTPDKQREVLWSVLGDLTPEDLQQRLNEYNKEVPKLGDWYFGRLIPDALSLVTDHHKHLKETILKGLKKEAERLETLLDSAPPNSPETYSESDHAKSQSDVDEVLAQLAAFDDVRQAHEAWLNAADHHRVVLADAQRITDLKFRTRLRIIELEGRETANPVKSLHAERDNQLALEEQVNADIVATQDLLSGDGPIPCAKGQCFRSVAREVGKTLEKFNDQLSLIRENVRSLTNAINEADEAAREAERLKPILDTPSIHTEDPGPEPEVPADLQFLIKRSGELQQTLMHHDAAKAHLGQAKAILAKRAEDQTKLAVVKQNLRHTQVLVEALGPRGVRALVMEAKVAQFIEQANTHLKDIAPPLSIEQASWAVRGFRGKWVPVALMSKSQVVRMSALGVQLELARRTGLPIFIDEAECMRVETLQKVLQFLAQTGVQVFVMRTAQSLADKRSPDFDIPGVSRFWVEGGTVTPL